jgi:outer membrane protein
MRRAIVVAVCLVSSLYGQSLGIAQAVERALEQYPLLRVNEEQIQIATGGVNLARQAYLPKVDGIAQLNRATRNNIYGMLLQQQVISPISGPPLSANAGTSVWGSAVGFLVSWEPFDFGLRRANIEVSDVARRRAEAGLKRTRFEVGAMAADAYLTVLAAEQTLEAALSGAKRMETVESVVGALVESGLRPGVDSSRTRSESASIRNQVIQAQQSLDLARASLAHLVNSDTKLIRVSRQRFLEMPPAERERAAQGESHPVAQEQLLQVEEANARRKALDKSYVPKFNAQATTYARGTGANADFTTGGPASGLGPNIYNWGLGLTVTFPLMDLPGLRVKREIEAHKGRAEQARYEQILRDLATQRNKAQANYDAAAQILKNTPVQLQSARESLEQATARYKAGLISILEVAETQRALTNAEIDDSLSRLALWRALLGFAIAEGDLSGFLAQAEGK